MKKENFNSLRLLIGKNVHLAIMPHLLPISYIGSFEGKPLVLGVTDKLTNPSDFTWIEISVPDYVGQILELSLIIKKSIHPKLSAFKFDRTYANCLLIKESLDKLPPILTLFPGTAIEKITTYIIDDLSFYIVFEHADNRKWVIHMFDWGMEINFNFDYINEVENTNDYREKFDYK